MELITVPNRRFSSVNLLDGNTSFDRVSKSNSYSHVDKLLKVALVERPGYFASNRLSTHVGNHGEVVLPFNRVRSAFQTFAE